MSPPPPPPLLLVANPGTRRADAVERAARDLDIPLTLLPWLELLQGRARLDEALHALDHPEPWLRFDSPGGHPEVERAFLVRGASLPDPLTRCARLSRAEARVYDRPPGLLAYPRQAFLGFRSLLEALARQREDAPPHAAMNTPEDIALMFDKPAAHRRLREAGAPVADALEAAPRDPDALLEALRARGWERAFVKLANGSSAVGVVALDLSEPALRAVTSTRARTRRGVTSFHNSLRLSTYEGLDEARPVLDLICAEGAHVERWIPKVHLDGGPCDLRVVTVEGRAAHRVVRVGRSPMTNLHLGNARGRPEDLRERVGDDAFQAALAAAERASAAFPRCLYAGVDVLISREARQPAVIEINAFGDLIPGVLHDGLETVPCTLRAALALSERAR